MADIARMRIQLLGAGVVGPAVMTFYHTAAGSGLPTAAKTMLTTLVGLFPDDLQFSVPNQGDLLDVATGALTGTWASGTPGVITGTQTSSFQIGAGIRVKWTTNGIVGGRRVRGTTFFVPASGGAFDTTGRVTTATLNAVDAAVAQFLLDAGGDLVIWSRPKPGRAGTTNQVITGLTQQTPTSLRSRRH
jgi:hypothetical protein